MFKIIAGFQCSQAEDKMTKAEIDEIRIANREHVEDGFVLYTSTYSSRGPIIEKKKSEKSEVELWAERWSRPKRAKIKIIHKPRKFGIPQIKLAWHR